MTNEEAKFILQAYRPGGQDAGDPQFADALEQAQKDPELGQWFLEQRNLDAAIASKFRQAPVPPALKTNILAGRKLIQPAHWWSRRSVFALAAAIAFLLALVSLWPGAGRSSGLAGFRSELAQMLSSGTYELKLNTDNFQQIQTWLAANGGHQEIALPPGLKGLPSFGCQVLDWKGMKVSMICFRSKGDGVVHLFVINRADLPDAPRPGSRLYARSGDWTTASWTQGEKTYLFAATSDRSGIEKFL